ncbi:hypothetical protein [Pseudaminobacter sp. NGMCC 1.201702]|uniref:hypothetical protein n=1 Tax=Pseudaminobacter sp. NGMCC 1.201702 TaxID=3391825 RepID=UPI0039EE14DC
MITLLPYALFISIIFVGALVAGALAFPGERATSVILCIMGFMFATLKIWLIQQTPQWHDVMLDARQYQLQAQAFADHWHGLAVDVDRMRVLGLQSRGQGTWPPNLNLPYSSIFGTHEWLFSAYLAVWKVISPNWFLWASYANAAFSAFFPAAAFGIARSLGAGRRVSILAGAAALFDPAAAVNGAWLLKDTLAGWLAIGAIWAGIRMRESRGLWVFVIFIIFTGFLGAVRFAALVAIFFACTAVALIFVFQRRWRCAANFGISPAFALLIFALFCALPLSADRVEQLNPFSSVTSIVRGQHETFVTTSSNNAASDETVIDWRNRLSENPIRALFTSASRTLFAPYPWVAITHGLSYDNGFELYYMGMILWIFCLPGILWSIINKVVRPTIPYVFILCILGSAFAGYTLFLGEWSTRQRVFLLPVFFALAAIGWADLHARWRERHRPNRRIGPLIPNRATDGKTSSLKLDLDSSGV